MPLYKKLEEKDTLLGVWKIEETLEDLFSFLPVPELYGDDVFALKSKDRQLERLAVRVLLYKLLNEEKEILYHPGGRPYLSDGSFCISISHTNEYVAVFLGNKDRIGVDIERYNERIHRVSRKYMSEDEVPVMYRGSVTWSLLLHWSAKETLFKCMGCESVDFKKHLRVYPSMLQEKGNFRAREFKTEYQYEYSVNYMIDTDFVLTWSIL